MEIRSIGIIGAGQMGNGIAHVTALAGYRVVMMDISQDSLTAALSLIEKNLERQVSSAKITAAEKAKALAQIDTTLDISKVGQADLVIEAATEDETIKQSIFDLLLPHLQDHTILTSNTSSISITRLASRTDRPEKFMGFHFMNPVPAVSYTHLRAHET